MKASELKEMSLQELNGRLKDLQDEQFNLNFQHATGQLENPMRLPQTRKEIARVLTVIRQKELAQA
jgi:large subunit ribosomal protein L29